MRRFNVEMVVGLFMIAGFLCFAWLSIQLGLQVAFYERYCLFASKR